MGAVGKMKTKNEQARKRKNKAWWWGDGPPVDLAFQVEA
jgi:hypothetical protein